MQAPLGLPLIVAHRGASAAAPENTLAAFEEARRQGARWIEFDTRLARCGTPIVLHDAKLRRTTGRRGRALDHDATAIGALDAGSWFRPAFMGEPVPTLAATLARAEALRLGCNVEIKAESAVQARAAAAAVAPLVEGARCPILVSSFSVPALEELRQSAPSIARGLLVGRRITRRQLAVAKALDAVSLHADRRAFRFAAAKRLKEAGLWPVAYTVNDPREARRLHHEHDVGTIITDRPGELLAAFGGQE